MMNDREIDAFGRIMAGILRHFPERFELEMDEHGWVNLYAFVDAVRTRRNFGWLRLHHIKAIVETDPKGRYQMRDNYIRATYGHSLNVDLDLPTDGIPETLYYPTTQQEADIILETGIKPADRTHVHLSKTRNDAEIAGLHRVKNPVILKIDAKRAIDDGVVVMQAGKTVYLTNEVPAVYLSRLEEHVEPSETDAVPESVENAEVQAEAPEDAPQELPEEQPQGPPQGPPQEPSQEEQTVDA